MNGKKLFFTLLAFFTIYYFFSSSVFASVSVEKLDGVVNWDKEDNYAEAKRALKIAKEINAEKRRRKQLRDAGVPEEEIKKIIQNERLAKANGNKVVNNQNTQNSQVKAKKNSGNYDDEYDAEDEDDEDDEDEDDDGSTKINNYSNAKNVGSNVNNTKNAKSYANARKATPKRQEIDLEQDDDDYIDEQIENERYAKAVNTIPEIPNTSVNVNINNKNNNKLNNEFSQPKDDSYDDWELTRLLKKAGENVNNRENFMMFAKEASKVANKKEKPDDFMDVDMLNAEITYEFDDDTYPSSSYRTQRYASRDAGRAKNTGKEKRYITYKTKGYKEKQQNPKIQSTGRFYASAKDEYKARKPDKEEKQYNVVMGKNNMTEKQIQAKNIGAPFPEARAKNNKKTQYLPQNIAQVAYDKNNRHLQPAVFESHIVSQVFEHLGDENAVQIARALINKVGNTDIADKDGNTLLMHAVARGNQTLIATLLAEGADPNKLNKEGFAPIHLATSYGDNVAVYAIMMHGGNPNLRDYNGNTALMYASKMCNADSVKLMISLGGDPTIMNKTTGRTAFDFAEESENPLIISMLERKSDKMFRKRHPVELNNN